ncbi:MAG: prolipoprotein diacylglyceryl transferase [Flavobacteriales bacterium]|nr:prolipoprotein diacylglyceryl transferase [Flavobacteriales bacterium]
MAEVHQLIHLLFEVAAFIVGYWYYNRSRGKQGDTIPDEKRVWIIIGAAAGALIGSRVLGALEDPSKLAWDLKALFIALNNRTIVGGLLGGLIGVEVTKLLNGVKQRSGDLFVFPIILGMIIGRIGCLLAGLEDNTYGIETDLPWGIDLGDGIDRHPTNLYEIVWLGIIWLALIGIERRWKLKPGARFQIFMVLYLEFRFAIEFIKPAEPVFFGLTAIQIAAELGVIYYWKVWTEPKSLLLQPRMDTDEHG